MRVKIRFSESGTIQINEEYSCEYTLYTDKYTVEMYLSVWEADKHWAIVTHDYLFFRWEKLFGKDRRISYWLTTRRLKRVLRKINRELQKLGIDGEIDVSLIG